MPYNNTKNFMVQTKNNELSVTFFISKNRNVNVYNSRLDQVSAIKV